MAKTKYKKTLGLPREARRAKWGQNFLKDPKILKKIADFAQIGKEDTVVEVGPGEGTLTELLLERAERVIAIEKDKYLAHELRIKNHELRLEIIHGDILESEQKILERTSAAKRGGARTSERRYFLRANLKNYVLVGNIPYYITGALFRKIFESENLPKSITFVVQKEVADRILARDPNSAKASPGKQKESILSISIKAYGTPEYGGLIKAGSFYPKPKVDSAIISIRNIGRERFLRSDFKLPRPKGQTFEAEGRFFQILKAGFSHKRKLLVGNLASRLNFDRQRLKEIFKKCNVPEKARAEDLSVENWLCLAREIDVK